MAIEIVDLPIKNGDFPVRYVSLPEGNWCPNHQCQRGTQSTNITRHLPHFGSGNSTACFSCKCHGWLHHKGHKVHKLFENKNAQSLKQLCAWKCGRHVQMANSKKAKWWYIWSRPAAGKPPPMVSPPLHTYIQAYLPTYLRTYVCTNVHKYIHTYIHAYLPTYVRTYINTYTHTYMHTYIHTYIHTCIHTYRQTYIHKYIHT